MGDVVTQPVLAPLSKSAIFLVLKLKPCTGMEENFRGFCADFSALCRTVKMHDLNAGFNCVMGIGAQAWKKIFPQYGQPKDLHPFKELKGGKHIAPSTAGDVLFHIRSSRPDLCFEMARLVMERLGSIADVADEVHGFKYFDDRDLIGFVDGTENPEGHDKADSVLIGKEDPKFAGGSYVIVQKYLHDMTAWNKLPTETQEKIIGRRKFDNVELDDKTKPDYAHNALNIVERDGQQVDILRDNMPFGTVGKGEFGTYFIGYARDVSVTEEMLYNMFIGKPKGNYDHLLDYSRAMTGGLFFVPALSFLDGLS